MYKFLLFVLLVVSNSYLLFSQNPTLQAIASGGIFCNSVDGMYKISFTIGETAVTTSPNVNNIIIAEGFQQGEVNNDTPPVFTEVKVYPNPISDNYLYVYLPYKVGMDSYEIKIYALGGQIIFFQKIEQMTHDYIQPFDFYPFPRGIFLVKVQSSDGSLLRTFKIEKF